MNARIIVALLAPFFYLFLACSGPRTPLEYTEDPPAPATLQEQLHRSLDSLNRVPGCRMEWRAALRDSVRVCPDPRPPEPPR